MDILERVDPNRRDEIFENHCRVYDFFKSVIDGGRVLDVGSGNGYGSEILSAGEIDAYTGVDYSENAVTFSKQTYHPYGRFFQMDAHSLEFPDDSFDWVISSENLEHLADPQKAVFEKARVLRTGGFALIGTPNKEMFSPGERGSPNPFHVDEFYYESLLQILEEAFKKVVIFENTLLPETRKGQLMRQERFQQGKHGVIHHSSGKFNFARRVWDLSSLENSHSFMAIAAKPRPFS
ncbi:MAG: class I SAM-dependent methyltransferase [Verrucomicrobiota bacterium]